MLHVPHAVVLFVVFVALAVMALLNLGAYFLGKRAKRRELVQGLDQVIRLAKPDVQDRLSQVLAELEAESEARADARQHAIRLVK